MRRGPFFTLVFAVAIAGCELVLGLDEKATAPAVPADATADAGNAMPCDGSFCDNFDDDNRPANVRGAWDLATNVGVGVVQIDHDWSASKPASLQFIYMPTDSGVPRGATLEKQFAIIPQTASVAFDYNHGNGSSCGRSPALATLRMGAYAVYVDVRGDGSPQIAESIPSSDGGSAILDKTTLDQAKKILEHSVHRFALSLVITDAASEAQLSVDGVEIGRRTTSAHLFRDRLNLTLGDARIVDNCEPWWAGIDNVVLEMK